MSKLCNTYEWEKISVDEYFSEHDKGMLLENEVQVYWDPIDEDYILESFGMPTYSSEDLEKIISYIKNEGFLDKMED